MDPTADLGAYTSFAWAKEPITGVDPGNGEPFDPFATNSLLDQRVRSSVGDVLIERSYVPADRDDADLLVRYYIVFRDRAALFSEPGFYGGIDGHLHHHHLGASVDVREYRAGVVIIDLIDAKRDAIVWRGWGVRRTRGETYDEEGVQELVRRILKQLPG